MEISPQYSTDKHWPFCPMFVQARNNYNKLANLAVQAQMQIKGDEPSHGPHAPAVNFPGHKVSSPSSHSPTTLLRYLKSCTRCQFLPNCMTSKAYLRFFCDRPSWNSFTSLRPYQLPLKVSSETNNCLHTPYRSKFKAASRDFPATARYSCLLLSRWGASAQLCSC